MAHLTKLMLAVVIALGLGSGPGEAASLKWTITSDHPNIVSLEFYSQSRNHVWPGNGDVFVIDDYNPNVFSLECRSGEQICYGAWVRGDSNTYWGVGRGQHTGCTTCCAVCGRGDVEGITLTR